MQAREAWAARLPALAGRRVVTAADDISGSSVGAVQAAAAQYSAVAADDLVTPSVGSRRRTDPNSVQGYAPIRP